MRVYGYVLTHAGDAQRYNELVCTRGCGLESVRVSDVVVTANAAHRRAIGLRRAPIRVLGLTLCMHRCVLACASSPHICVRARESMGAVWTCASVRVHAKIDVERMGVAICVRVRLYVCMRFKWLRTVRVVSVFRRVQMYSSE